ncbi:helix-turn-helix transcriptional regulator [Henriciella aquimarina]|uniref:helix-turn-helix transcriptional regulator n=1 Tax=Henriciella aquimarina TaxID=545261 RepID=UPI001301F958|nr:helix-turn-helix transcriptional regulator [Henriciella aquimarina]
MQSRSNEPRAQLHVPTAQTLSGLLLALYDAARTPAVTAFQDEALTIISRIIPFDASIWGIGTVGGEKTDVQGAHLRNFGQDTVDFLNRKDAQNIVGQALREQPGVAHIFSARDVFHDPQTEYIWRHMGGVRQVLCHGSIDPKTGLMSFFAIARRDDDHPFTQTDRHWIEILAPHLEATLQICRVSELQQLISQSSPLHTRSAVSDARGVLHIAEPGFAELLREEWPQWRGPHLPEELTDLAAAPDREEMVRNNITISVTGVAHQRIITARRRPAVDRLTAQEKAVAQAFAQGASYKEVAQKLDRSPATVRHHLRSIYTKLGVRDKGALARIIFETAGTPD